MSALQNKYDEYNQTIRSLEEHLQSVESQIYEHKIVVETLKGVPSDRKAWRLINNGDSVVSSAKEDTSLNSEVNTANGALVETTAGSAAVKLDETINGLNELKSKINKEVTDLKKEFDDWKQKNHIKIFRG